MIPDRDKDMMAMVYMMHVDSMHELRGGEKFVLTSNKINQDMQDIFRLLAGSGPSTY